MNLRSAVLSVCPMLLACNPVCAALNTQLVGVGWSFSNSPLYAIDKATGSGQQLGLAGTMHLNSLAQNSAGVLYSTGGPIPTNSLFAINPASGLATFVTSTIGANDDFRALAFSADDLLYGVAEGNPDNLVTISVETGVVSTIGPLGMEGIQGLDFAPDGTLYGWDVLGIGLVTINPTTGQAIDVDSVVGSDSSIQSIAFDSDGVLYGAAQSLFRVNLATGETTLVGSGGFNDMRGLEFILVPEPTSLGIMAAGCLVLLSRYALGISSRAETNVSSFPSKP